jgi:hypothetical protein
MLGRRTVGRCQRRLKNKEFKRIGFKDAFKAIRLK